MRTLTGLALAGTVLAMPALAGQHDDKGQNPPKEKKICRSESVTGSIMPRRTCHTAAQWAAIDAQNQDNAQTALDHARRSTGAIMQ